jgi:hypothetical protein
MLIAVNTSAPRGACSLAHAPSWLAIWTATTCEPRLRLAAGRDDVPDRAQALLLPARQASSATPTGSAVTSFHTGGDLLARRVSSVETVALPLL